MTGYSRKWKCNNCGKAQESVDWPKVGVCEGCEAEPAGETGPYLVEAPRGTAEYWVSGPDDYAAMFTNEHAADERAETLNEGYAAGAAAERERINEAAERVTAEHAEFEVQCDGNGRYGVFLGSKTLGYGPDFCTALTNATPSDKDQGEKR